MCSIARQIRKEMVDADITSSEVARRCGWSNSSFCNRLRRDNFTMNDLEKVASAMNKTIMVSFVSEQVVSNI